MHELLEGTLPSQVPCLDWNSTLAGTVTWLELWTYSKIISLYNSLSIQDNVSLLYCIVDVVSLSLLNYDFCSMTVVPYPR